MSIEQLSKYWNRSVDDQPRHRGRRFRIISLVILALMGVIVMTPFSNLGNRPSGDRLSRIAQSPQYSIVVADAETLLQMKNSMPQQEFLNQLTDMLVPKQAA